MIAIFLVVALNGGYHQFIKSNVEQSNECCETMCGERDLERDRIQ